VRGTFFIIHLVSIPPFSIATPLAYRSLENETFPTQPARRPICHRYSLPQRSGRRYTTHRYVRAFVVPLSHNLPHCDFIKRNPLREFKKSATCDGASSISSGTVVMPHTWLPFCSFFISRWYIGGSVPSSYQSFLPTRFGRTAGFSAAPSIRTPPRFHSCCHDALVVSCYRLVTLSCSKTVDFPSPYAHPYAFMPFACLSLCSPSKISLCCCLYGRL
jgi:hypothetical protein